MRNVRAAAVWFLFPVVAFAQRGDRVALQERALQLYRAGQYEAAIPLYRKLADIHPDKTPILKDLLIVQWLGGRYSDAVELGSKLTRQSKNDFDVWFIYARALLANGEKEKALRAFRRCRELAPNDPHVQLAEARLEATLRDYPTALAHMKQLRQRYPDFKEVYPELARLQQLTKSYGMAAETWAHAVEFFPENKEYKFHEAECLYFDGRQAAATAKLKALAVQVPSYGPAIDFLTDSALARGELDTAETLLEENLKTIKPDDEARLLKMVGIYQKQKRWEAVIATTNRLLTLHPHSGYALMFKADALRQRGRYSEAVDVYKQLLRENPAAVDAWVGIARTENAAGHPEKALKAVEAAIALDPTDPYLLILQSYSLYARGDQKAHRDVLEQWIAAHPQPALPVLLYHGLTPYPGDPLLASSLHRSTAAFAEQMSALHEARYTAVTADQVSAWQQGSAALPEKPILITFDDARLDSLQYADPILKEYGFKATMFAPLRAVEGYSSASASWKDLERYHRTGRWDIQSHGDRAHEHIPVDEQGRLGLFLLNKKWLEGARRMETTEEWTRRVRKDHKDSQQKIKRHTGKTPRAYSFPEGNFGHADISNSPEAAPLNLKWAGEFFQSAYHQDDYGFNVLTRDPMHLTRYEPPATQTGAALMRHLSDQSPATLMIRRLLREAVWTRRTHEAYQWLDALREQGASSSAVWAEEARIRTVQGDWEGARFLAERAYREDNSPENRELLDELKRTKGWFWRGGFAYQEDDRHRYSRRFRQDLGYWRAAGFDVSAHQLFGSYSESGVETVTENGGGLGVARNLGSSHRVAVEATGHFLSADVKDNYSLLGFWHAGWTPDVSTDLEGGRSIYDTARAIHADVISRFVDGVVSWKPQTDWRAFGRLRLEDLSDNNQRATGSLEGGRRAFLPRFWIVARALLDSTDNISPNYYSPQLLQEYQLGFDYTLLLSRGSNLNVIYLPGYGKEKVSDGVLVHDLDIVLNLALTPSLTLSPTVALIRQPSYDRNTYSALLTYRF